MARNDFISYARRAAKAKSVSLEADKVSDASYDAGVAEALKFAIRLTGDGLTSGMLRRILVFKLLEIELKDAGGTDVQNGSELRTPEADADQQPNQAPKKPERT